MPEIPEAPPGYPTADPAAVQRARTDGGLRLRIARSLWRGDDTPSTYAQIGGYLYEIADRVAAEIEGRPLPAHEAKATDDGSDISDDDEIARALMTAFERGDEIRHQGAPMNDLQKLTADLAEALERHHEAVPNVPGELGAVRAVVDEYVAGLRDRAERAEAILRDLVDPDPCYFDHNEFCQAHGHRSPCPHARAAELLSTHPVWGRQGSRNA